jgi:squalene-hopene/tetraprenyl-beta-curcumene cyclase
MSRAVVLTCVVAVVAGGVRAGEREAFPKPGPNKADEPLAKVYSPAKAAEFLDRAAVNWTRDRNCATCHTNVPYVMARGALTEGGTEGIDLVRTFFEERVKSWADGKPRKAGEPVAIAAPLALQDARGGKLQPLARKALDAIWTAQRSDGAWNWPKCQWPPFEHDDYYGAVLAAVAVGHAPENYAATEKAKEGLERLRGYFRKTPPPTLHHKAWLMWASLKLDGLMTKPERDQTITELLGKQHADGGWSLASLGDWKGFDGRANNVDAASDGYGTGFVVHVLRQAGLGLERKEIRHGIDWLKANQRQSGRWYTPSLNTDRAHYITHAGTAFAVLALAGTEQK